MGGTCNTYERENKLIISIGNPEGMKRLWRHKRRCEDNIKVDNKEIGYKCMHWIHVADNVDR